MTAITVSPSPNHRGHRPQAWLCTGEVSFTAAVSTSFDEDVEKNHDGHVIVNDG